MMKIVNSITGPLSPDELRALAAAPFGEAAKVIRKYDPLWGRAEGEPITWTVKCCRRLSSGVAEVVAASQDEADDLAAELLGEDVEWDTDYDDFDILSVSPRT